MSECQLDRSAHHVRVAAVKPHATLADVMNGNDLLVGPQRHRP